MYGGAYNPMQAHACDIYFGGKMHLSRVDFLLPGTPGIQDHQALKGICLYPLRFFAGFCRCILFLIMPDMFHSEPFIKPSCHSVAESSKKAWRAENESGKLNALYTWLPQSTRLWRWVKNEDNDSFGNLMRCYHSISCSLDIMDTFLTFLYFQQCSVSKKNMPVGWRDGLVVEKYLLLI